MNYLVFKPNEAPYYVSWCSPEMFVEGMYVVNLHASSYTEDGFVWKSVKYVKI